MIGGRENSDWEIDRRREKVAVSPELGATASVDGCDEIVISAYLFFNWMCMGIEGNMDLRLGSTRSDLGAPAGSQSASRRSSESMCRGPYQ